MFHKLILIAIWCYLFNVAQGQKNKVLNVTHSTLITRGYLHKDDFINISIILDLQIDEESQMKPPLVIFSVTTDKTLNYNIDPIFPYLTEEKPVLELNSAQIDDFIVSPSTEAFEIDFTMKTLVAVPLSSIVHLFSNVSTIERDSKTVLDETGHMIQMRSSKVGVNIRYNFRFVFSATSEGLHGLRLHSFKNVPITFETNKPAGFYNVLIIWYCVEVVAYLFVICLIWSPLGWKLPLTLRLLCCSTAVAKVAYCVIRFQSRIIESTGDHGIFYSTCCSLLQLIYLCIFHVQIWHDWNKEIEGFHFNKALVKVCHILEWLMMIHLIFCNYYNRYYNFYYCKSISRHFETMAFFFWMTIKSVYFFSDQETLAEIEDDQLKESKPFKELTETYWTRFCRSQYLVGIYFFVQSSGLISALTVALNVPLHLYWITLIIGDLLLYSINFWFVSQFLSLRDDPFEDESSDKTETNRKEKQNKIRAKNMFDELKIFTQSTKKTSKTQNVDSLP